MIRKKQTPMRILITGGAGFIGSHLANRLDELGHYVRVIDDLSSGDPSRLSPNINQNRGDVCDIPKLWSLLQGIDIVYHLAARVSVPASQLYPKEYNEVNVGGTVSLLEACRDVGIRRVVLGSSAAAYGNQAIQPITEQATPHPASPYAVSKVAAEQYLFNVARHGGFESIPQFMHQILGKGSVVIHGDGTQTRDFVYIDDVVTALVSAGQAPNIDGQVINVGSGEEISMNQLIEQISTVAGIEPSVLYNSDDSGGTARLVGDLTLAQNLLRYRPSTQLANGLQKLLQHDPTFQPKSSIDSRRSFSLMPRLAVANR